MLAFGCKSRRDSISTVEGDSSAILIQSPYRLVFVHDPSKTFDPNRDVLNPSRDQLMEEEGEDAFRRSIMVSVLPMLRLMGQDPGASSLSLHGALMTMASQLQDNLIKTLGPRLAQLKLRREVYVVPWKTARDQELYYDQDKISANADRLANVVGTAIWHKGFPTKLTESIKTLQSDLYEHSPYPFYLLGGRYLTLVADGKAQTQIDLLIGLKPQPNIPFKKDSDKVKLEKAVIPDIPGRGTTVAVTIKLDLKRQEKPTMDMVFGDFDRFDRGEIQDPKTTQFVLAADDAHRTAPHLEGTPAQRGLGFVALDFSFRELTFDLEKLSVSGVQVLISPGLKLGKIRKTGFKIHSASVDEEFRKEIDASLESSKREAVEKILSFAKR